MIEAGLEAIKLQGIKTLRPRRSGSGSRSQHSRDCAGLGFRQFYQRNRFHGTDATRPGEDVACEQGKPHGELVRDRGRPDAGGAGGCGDQSADQHSDGRQVRDQARRQIRREVRHQIRHQVRRQIRCNVRVQAAPEVAGRHQARHGCGQDRGACAAAALPPDLHRAKPNPRGTGTAGCGAVRRPRGSDGGAGLCAARGHARHSARHGDHRVDLAGRHGRGQAGHRPRARRQDRRRQRPRTRHFRSARPQAGRMGDPAERRQRRRFFPLQRVHCRQPELAEHGHVPPPRRGDAVAGACAVRHRAGLFRGRQAAEPPRASLRLRAR